MIELQEHNGKLKVENYGLMEWATDVQSAVQQGYEIDTSNEGYPQNFGSLYTCLMVEQKVPDKQAETSVVLPVDEVKDVLVIAPWQQIEQSVVSSEETNVSEQETEVRPEELFTIAPQVQQQGKRGPKPKN